MSKEILIVEDEPMIADDLAIIIATLGYKLAGIADNGKDALRIINSEKIDLVLLDVKIKGELDGIQIAEKLNLETEVPFIFITSFYDDDTLYKIRATNPAAYIVKPFKDADIKANLSLAFSRSNKLNDSKIAVKQLFVKNQGEMIRLEPSTVVYIQGEDNYTTIFTEQGKRYTITQTLKSLTEQFEPYGFIRVHKSYTVNKKMISSINGSMLYIDAQGLPIGKSYRKNFLSTLTIV